MGSEVQSLQARTGLPILVVRGCATASSVDPMAEAERWYKLVEPQLRDLPTSARIAVLGLGSGYHVMALAEAVAKTIKRPITVFESDPSLEKQRSWYVGRFPEHVAVNFVDVGAGSEKFFAAPEVRSLISGRLVLLRHKPSFLRDQRGLTKLGNWLTGRDRSSLIAHLQGRVELTSLLDSEKKSGDWLLSVKDLSRLWKLEAEVTEQRRLFRILEELVR